MTGKLEEEMKKKHLNQSLILTILQTFTVLPITIKNQPNLQARATSLTTNKFPHDGFWKEGKSLGSGSGDHFFHLILLFSPLIATLPPYQALLFQYNPPCSDSVPPPLPKRELIVDGWGSYDRRMNRAWGRDYWGVWRDSRGMG